MKHLIAALALLGALTFAQSVAADVYNLSITMPSVTGAATCKPYVGATALAAKPCGSAQSYPGAITTEGSYAFTYAGVSALGTEGDKSPPSVTYVIDKKPGTPTNPPGVTIQCRDASGVSVACPPNITITAQ